MGQRGREAFEERYTLFHAAERYDTVLQQYIYGMSPVSILRE
jgi:hypothetical protein